MKSSSCVVIDYGIGNTFSVMHALKSLGVEAVLSRNTQEIMAAERVILPGVGAFGRAAQKLRTYGLDEIIYEFVQTERPFLGICVGMQLLMEESHEFGVHEGLGIIKGKVKKISVKKEEGQTLRVPLIGWYPLTLGPSDRTHSYRGLLQNSTPAQAAFYFVHSFAAHPEKSESILATVDHSGQHVVAAIQHNNVLGVQFHPERSGGDGRVLLDRFLSC